MGGLREQNSKSNLENVSYDGMEFSSGTGPMSSSVINII